MLSELQGETPMYLTSPEAPVSSVSLSGEVARDEIVEVDAVLRSTHQRGVKNVLLDFADVTHFDYRGLHLLLQWGRRFEESGGRIKIFGMTPYIYAIFRYGGAHEAFEYFDDYAKAMASFDRADLKFTAR